MDVAISYVHLKILKKILKKILEKILKKILKKLLKNSIFSFNIFSNIFVHFQDDHRKNSTETQFHANFVLISYAGEKYWKIY